MKKLKFLFIPVSSAQGIGEYARSMIIAEEVQKFWPESDIHFILSREAPYSSECSFNTHLVAKSPTKETAEVKRIIKQLSPDIVIFDASGRAQQLAYAKKCGAKVIFISQNKKKRARGIKYSRSRHTDIHWVVQPDYAIQPLSFFQKLKIKCLHLPYPKNVGTIYSIPSERVVNDVIENYALQKQQYIVVSSGSGGHLVSGGLAADLFARVALLAHEITDLPVVFIYGANYPKETLQLPGLITLKEIKNEDFIALLSNSSAAILSGGGSLLQAIAMNVPTLGIALANDQISRINACVEKNLILTSSANFYDMSKNIKILMQQESRNDLRSNMIRHTHTNGLELVMCDLKKLFK